MAVPKRKQSNSRTGKRRSHDRLRAKNLTVCPKCSHVLPTHVVCPNCGYYMGRVVTPSETTAEE
ncbi:MAG TPA: 50S ribosomal protein L32 [Pirellulaceae bacterium]|nr:50S ribosomal protein L32 [Pirellulaceae bacterium]HMO93228.1 50S ribosomal protein L32 [Pirellulaceae bacterium]HMP70059.1 50S ribosomal protein L32 [Pirellulaceae bacterium]